MRAVAWMAALAFVEPAGGVEPPSLPPGETVEAQASGDFDGDGSEDIAYIAASDDHRTLHISLAGNDADRLPLEFSPFGAATLAFAKGVLVFEDMHGGTTALAATYRYRFDKAENRMRLIGVDATHYSRTYAHDAFEISWNLVTGELLTRDMKLNRKGGEAAYDLVVERRHRRKSGKVWLSETPDSETLEEMMGSLRG